MSLISGGEPKPAVKDPEELSDEEQEARQTGMSVEEVVTARATPMVKKKTEKKTKKGATKTKAPKAKKATKATKGATAKAAGSSAKSKSPKKPRYVKKGEKSGSPSKRGPKGSKNPKRDAPDGGVFGRKVDRARKEKGWTQAFLAAKIEITQPAICNIIKGTAGASEKTTAKLSKVLGLK